ncbi:hypothetical protein BJV82DRAFT_610018 [Fennellomyces sp. T-0311]|nr:hypothetical protein BJV82DRAFT_610018 [Fennellomyces sp. T-0311]
MSSANGITEKQKRNKPCESCRAHRRKCSVLLGTICERCKRLSLPCLFKFSVKPSNARGNSGECGKIKPKRPSRRPMSLLRKTQLSDKVRLLQQQITAMEHQLQSLGTYMRSDKSTRKQFWSLVVNRSIHGDLTLDTSVQSIGELMSFMEQTWSCFAPDTRIFRTPMYFTDRTDRFLSVTQPYYRVEQVLYSLVRDLPSKPISACNPDPTVAEASARQCGTNAAIDDENPALMFVKHNLINVFFGCHGYLTPAFVRMHFLDYLQANPNSMLANAMVAFVACSACRHVKLVNLPFTRQELGAACMLKARRQLEDAVFEDDDGEPTIEKMATMWLLTNCLTYNLRKKEARTLLNMAWRMAIQLKDIYLPVVLQFDDPDKAAQLDRVIAAKAETWRRLFYIIRHLELSMYMVYDGLVDFTSIIFHSKIGYPTILPEEKSNPVLSKAVEIYRYLITLSTLPGGCEIATREELVAHRLLAGALNKVSCADIEFIEKRLLEFWYSLPRAYTLCDQPIAYLDDAVVQNCTDPNILFLSHMYYIYWLILHARLMEEPAKADMTNFSLDRMDNERALVIVSISTDALTKLSMALLAHMPCSVEMHWMAILCDMLRKLTACTHSEIKTRAEKNLVQALSILNSCMQHIFTESTGQGAIWDSESTTSSELLSCHGGSPSTLPSGVTSVSTAYYKEFKRQIGEMLTLNQAIM